MACKIGIKRIYYKLLAIAEVAIGIALIGVGAGMVIPAAIIGGICILAVGACSYLFVGIR